MTIPRPGVRASAHLPLADTKAARQAARPVEQAGGEQQGAETALVAGVGTTRGGECVAQTAPFSFPPPPTSACAGTQPGGRGIHLTTGRKASVAPLLEGRLPVVTSHPYLQH